MAHNKSAKKRIRQNAVRRLRNRYNLSTTKSVVKRLRNTTDKEAAMAMIPNVVSQIDKCVKHSIFHKNKGSNLKGKLMRAVNAL